MANHLNPLSATNATKGHAYFPGRGPDMRPRPPSFFANPQTFTNSEVPQDTTNPYRGATAASLLSAIQSGWIPGFRSAPALLSSKNFSNPYKGADAASLLSSIQSGWIPYLHSTFVNSQLCYPPHHPRGSTYSFSSSSSANTSAGRFHSKSSPNTSGAEDEPLNIVSKNFVAKDVEEGLGSRPSLLDTGRMYERREAIVYDAVYKDAKHAKEVIGDEGTQQDQENDIQEVKEKAISHYWRTNDPNARGHHGYRKKRGVKLNQTYPSKSYEANSEDLGYEGEDEDEYGHLSFRNRLSLRSRIFEEPWDFDRDEGAETEYPLLDILSFRNENRIPYIATFGSETSAGYVERWELGDDSEIDTDQENSLRRRPFAYSFSR